MKKRIFSLLTAAMVLCVALSGCGMNKEKAIEQLESALKENASMDSGNMTAEVEAQVQLGSDSIDMNLAVEGAFKDQMQTMALKISGDMMGMPLDSQLYQTEGFSYTLDPESGKYLKQESAMSAEQYQNLMTLSQTEMVEMYLDAAKVAEDFAFTEEEKALRINFTMPTEQLEQMQQLISTTMLDEMLPMMEQQLRSSVEEQLDALLGSMELDQEQLDALIDEQIQALIEMEKQLFTSLQITKLHCDMLIEDGAINEQTLEMGLEFALKDLVEALGMTDAANVPETCALNMNIHSLVQNRNEDIQIEIPEFTAENLLAA